MPGDELLFVMLTRLAPDDSDETEPASSSVAPLATVAVTPAPTEAAPVVGLNRSVLVPPTAIELAAPSEGARSTSNTPLPPTANAEPALLVNVPLNEPLDPPAKTAVVLMMLNVPPPLLVTRPVKIAGL